MYTLLIRKCSLLFSIIKEIKNTIIWHFQDDSWRLRQHVELKIDSFHSCIVCPLPYALFLFEHRLHKRHGTPYRSRSHSASLRGMSGRLSHLDIPVHVTQCRLTICHIKLFSQRAIHAIQSTSSRNNFVSNKMLSNFFFSHVICNSLIHERFVNANLFSHLFLLIWIIN